MAIGDAYRESDKTKGRNVIHVIPDEHGAPKIHPKIVAYRTDSSRLIVNPLSAGYAQLRGARRHHDAHLGRQDAYLHPNATELRQPKSVTSPTAHRLDTTFGQIDRVVCKYSVEIEYD
jgi:hypothetical protein